MARAWDAIVIGSESAAFRRRPARQGRQNEGPGAGEALGTRRPDPCVPTRRRGMGRRPPLCRRTRERLDHPHRHRFSLGRRARMEADDGRFERFLFPALVSPSFRPRTLPGAADRALSRQAPRSDLFRDLRSVAAWHVLGVQQQFLPEPLAFLFAQWRRLGAAKATQTTGDISTAISGRRNSEPCSHRNGTTTACRRAKARSRCTPS